MIRKKVKHIYFKSFIDNADIINTHNYFTSYSEFFSLKKLVNKNRNIDFCDKYGFQKEWFSNLFAINGYCISNENPS